MYVGSAWSDFKLSHSPLHTFEVASRLISWHIPVVPGIRMGPDLPKGGGEGLVAGREPRERDQPVDLEVQRPRQLRPVYRGEEENQ